MASSRKKKDALAPSEYGEDVGMLLALASEAPDSVLSLCLPQHPPETVRDCLRSAAAFLASAGWSRQPAGQESGKKKSSSPSPDAELHVLSVFTDGASRGNPGHAGAGVQILDQHGREVMALGRYLGQCTNNMAEYQALIIGLAEAGKLGGRKISIFLDSELIVRQIAGRYRVKDAKLKPLFDRVKVLLSAFETWQVRHVPRADNRRADELANQGIDSHLHAT